MTVARSGAAESTDTEQIDDPDPPVSVLLAVYDGDRADHVDAAIESVFDQSHPPAELVIVQDGPIGDSLTAVIDRWKSKYPDVVTRIPLEENQGLGRALQVGLQHCTHDLVARMDADDVSVPDRLAIQVEYMRDHPEVDVVGGYVAEFDEDPDTIEGVRAVPTDPDAIAEQASYRCPLNHPTVMYRKAPISAVGGYSDLRSMQDYELWMRLLDHDYTLANVPEVLVKARAGSNLSDRRGGLDYARTEYRLLRTFSKRGYISVYVLLVNLFLRIPLRLIPGPIRERIYTHVLRRR